MQMFNPTFEPLIETSGLTKRFGSVQAIMNLNLRVMPGEIYGLLGPNGAGKSTTIKVILGLIEPTAGWIKVAGFDPAKNPIEVKSKIGYVAENPIVYDSLSPRDFLEFVSSVRGIEALKANDLVTRLAKAFSLTEYFDSPIATLSLGMKQKVNLRACFVHKPPVLLLDEPFNGLDAKSSRIVKDLISFHVQAGGSVLFSTHIMEVAEQVCTRIGIIDKGRIVAEGTLDQLRKKTQDQTGSLEDVFLKLTREQDEIAQTTKTLREVYFKHEAF